MAERNKEIDRSMKREAGTEPPPSSSALKNAWKDACASTNAAKILIPTGTYKIGQVDLRGPFKALIEVQNLEFGFLNNSIVRDITSKDTKIFHVNVLGCNNVTFANFTINAPATSPNTDGIHIGRSSEINIIDSFISTSDDCISLGDGNRNINALRVICGPGHGISVGSL
ncbi:polygalacturonase-like [Senna tora]|uniref:Polygalacturonase-like n=1 Tax=Senna tora TaxID=362788 RepID=A0A834SN79_9FABA|nr:polygalacturonase-like [Senna tora]KAF7807170.1 polygalacturonase-like [Senna tora]